MLTATRLRLRRTQILDFRRAVQALDGRLPHDRSSLRRAAWAGLQDSMPRAALLVENAAHHGRVWTSRVWPGALLVGGAIVGTWRRAEAAVSIETWRRLSAAERHAVEAEVASLPLPGMAGGMAAARWLA